MKADVYVLSIFRPDGEYHMGHRHNCVEHLKATLNHWEEQWQKVGVDRVGFTYKIEKEITTRELVTAGRVTT